MQQTRLFGVIRHAERADGAFSFVNGVRWTQTPDFAEWPFDPPLSDEGLKGAQGIAERIKGVVTQCGSSKTRLVIVSSPYTRCIQTAAAIAHMLGPDARMLVDVSLGEIYGPSVMGDSRPQRTARPLEVMPRNAGLARPVHISRSALIGQWPTWPEDTKSARRRFAMRFLIYLRRSQKMRRNFLLVSHGDCVAAALSMMPSHAGQIVERIEYGGMFLATSQPPPPGLVSRFFTSARSWLSTGSVTSERRKKKNATASRAPTLEEKLKEKVKEIDKDELLLLQEEPLSPGSKKLVDFNCAEDSDGGGVDATSVHQGWQVQTFDIKMNEAPGRASVFKSRVKSYSKKSNLSEEMIEQLLSGLTFDPLGDPLDQESKASGSTLIFGQELSMSISQQSRIPGSGRLSLNGSGGGEGLFVKDLDGPGKSKDTNEFNRVRQLKMMKIKKTQDQEGDVVDEEPSDVPKLTLSSEISIGQSSIMKRRFSRQAEALGLS
mmetsp:Transcript_144475/g.402485  ORF Transcript_144475/g.402485 Transcript_144475/m.402485 type:complete len:490 (-) Transcript_144475:108-1577(-)